MYLIPKFNELKTDYNTTEKLSEWIDSPRPLAILQA